MEITRGIPYPLGAQITATGVNFAYVSEKKDCGVVLFEKKTLVEKQRIPFPAEYAVGKVFCIHVGGIDIQNTAYCFYEQERLVTDERGRAFAGRKNYNAPQEAGKVNPACFVEDTYDWEGDLPLEIPYEESIGYCMHVRGFTRHASSKVKAKGCFAGIVEKIPYLKDLGITMLELQPAYEFDELTASKKATVAYYINPETEEYKLNYWGYTKGCYYAPKASYAYGNDAVLEFKDMIKALHKNGIEVVMQFFFTENSLSNEIVEILRYWLLTYHVDGFHLKGENVPVNEVIKDPVLARTKIWYYGFDLPAKEVPAYEQVNVKRYLAEYRDDYRYDMRRFLKGDDGMLHAVMHHLRYNPAGVGRINYLTNYDGFTLADLVSYERKHNEENGEDNKDGNDFNASWNCGQEGVSRKKTVQTLRMKQMKNALLLLFLSQATPLLFMGDEFCNSQDGNNNPYCQDNKITWLNWKETENGKEIYGFVKALIALRKEHPVLRQEKELRMMDYGACGYPDVSYHGEAPWKPDLSHYSRQLGVMYCGKYACKAKNVPDDFFYIAYNMHWEPCSFALPKLPKGMEYKLLLTGEENGVVLNAEKTDVTLPGRCICVFVSTVVTAEKKAVAEKENKTRK